MADAQAKHRLQVRINRVIAKTPDDEKKQELMKTYRELRTQVTPQFEDLWATYGRSSDGLERAFSQFKIEKHDQIARERANEAEGEPLTWEMLVDKLKSEQVALNYTKFVEANKPEWVVERHPMYGVKTWVYLKTIFRKIDRSKKSVTISRDVPREPPAQTALEAKGCQVIPLGDGSEGSTTDDLAVTPQSKAPPSAAALAAASPVAASSVAAPSSSSGELWLGEPAAVQQHMTFLAHILEPDEFAEAFVPAAQPVERALEEGVPGPPTEAPAEAAAKDAAPKRRKIKQPAAAAAPKKKAKKSRKAT